MSGVVFFDKKDRILKKCSFEIMEKVNKTKSINEKIYYVPKESYENMSSKQINDWIQDEIKKINNDSFKK
jgi:DNA polymerase III alpha subunit (gram-positive type)